MKLHEKNFKCDMCDKAFGRASALNEHKNIVHFRQKNYECQTCMKKFLRRGSLRVHINNIHLKISRVTCDICEKQFARIANLQIHKRICHTLGTENEEGFRCGEEGCNKSFRYSVRLREHFEETHSGILNQCDQCPKVCSKKRWLAGHKRKVHGKNRAAITAKEERTEDQVDEMSDELSGGMSEDQDVHPEVSDVKERAERPKEVSPEANESNAESTKENIVQEGEVEEPPTEDMEIPAQEGMDHAEDEHQMNEEQDNEEEISDIALARRSD